MVGSAAAHEVNAPPADAFKAVFKHVVEDGSAFEGWVAKLWLWTCRFGLVFS